MNAIELAQELGYDAQKIRYHFEKTQKRFAKKGVYIVRVDENEFGIQLKDDETPRFNHIERRLPL